MFKVPNQVYTAEFKEAAVQRVKDEQGLSAVACELGMSTQRLRNWQKGSEAGKLIGPGAKVVTAEQMELEIAKKLRRYPRRNDMNALNRNFTPAEPNQVFTSDITYVWSDEGWLYLAVTLDLFNREVVGWPVKPRMTADLVTDALAMAWFCRRPAPRRVASFGQRQSIREPRIPVQTALVRHAMFDELEGQLLV